MPIETFPNNGSADKAGKWKERELQIFNPSPSESNLGGGNKKVNIHLQWLSWKFWSRQVNINILVDGKVIWMQAAGVACTLPALLL